MERNVWTNSEAVMSETKRTEIKRWAELSIEERLSHNIKARELVRYLSENQNKVVTWNQVNNKLGLSHLYKFVINDYNYSHVLTKLRFDKNGIWCEAVEKPDWRR